MVSKIRAERIADGVFRELSTLLIMEVSDPRIETASITDVVVDRELAYAKIYVSSIIGSEAAPMILEGLNHARGYLRRELSRRIPLRSFPQLRFYWDSNPERADHIEKLLNSLPEADTPTQTDEEADLLDE
jgi:ribosome-binding factor A